MREFDQNLIAQHVEVGFDGVQRDELRRFLNPVRRRVDAGDLALHLALRGKAVEQHLGERQLGFRAQQRGRAIVAIVPISGDRTVGVLGTGGAAHVDGRQVLGAGLTQFLLDRLAVGSDHAHFRIGFERGLDTLLDRGRKGEVCLGHQRNHRYRPARRKCNRQPRGASVVFHSSRTRLEAWLDRGGARTPSPSVIGSDRNAVNL